MAKSEIKTTPIPKLEIQGRSPRVLLIYPFNELRNNAPPLSLAMIGAVLRDKGCDVKVVDSSAARVEDGDARITDAFENYKPDAVAMSLIVGNARVAYLLINEVLSKWGIPIIAGGPHVSILPHEPLKHGAHISVKGEGEETAADLVDWMEGSKELSAINGISYIGDDGSIQTNPDRPPINDLDALPLPAHDLFDPDDYFSRPEDAVIAGKLLSSRGCPNKCSFCSNPVFGRKFRYRSPEAVIAEIHMLRERYNIDQFEFLDDAFSSNRKRMLELAQKLSEEPDLTFSCVTRLENLDEETVPALRAAGLFRVHIGIESGRAETLKRIHKNIDLDKLEHILRLLRKNGIESYLFFMHGFPWETADEMREANEYIESLRPITAWFSEGGVVCPLPGTEIYEEYHKSVGFTEWWLTGWQPDGPKPLHHLQPYYFFPYDLEQIAIIREGLNLIFEHNRCIHDVATNPSAALRAIERLNKIIANLEEQVRDRDRQLRKVWDQSLEKRIKRIWNSLKGSFGKSS